MCTPRYGHLCERLPLCICKLWPARAALVVGPNHWGRIGWKRPLEAQSLGSCSKALHGGMVGCAGKAYALVRHELPMVNGELGLPEMPLLRCPSE